MQIEARDGPAPYSGVNMPLFCALALFFSLLLNMPAAAEPPPSWAQAAAVPDVSDITRAAPPERLSQALAGHWRGALHYRDYSSDKAVTLPTTVSIDDALRFAFTYDDGPGKMVRSNEQWSFDGAVLNPGKAGKPLQVSLYRGNENGDLILVALGSGVENDQPVELRLVVLRRGDTLSISRSSRLPQQEWLLRHVYRLTAHR